MLEKDLGVLLSAMLKESKILCLFQNKYTPPKRVKYKKIKKDVL
jgi:hypothetical protein